MMGTVSIVIFNSSVNELRTVIMCTIKSSIKIIYVIDNGPNDSMREFVCGLSEKVVYIQGQGNIGFGAAHNIAIKKSIESGATYHFVINPDIEIPQGAIEKLIEFMDNNPTVGLVMPKVVYPDGKIQYLCKLLPSPWDLIGRRFLPFLPMAKKRKAKYELHNLDFNKTYFDVPSLSGCFMLFRTEIFKQIGGFDERFFMYMEDVDLCRRVHAVSQTAYFPEVSVVHQYAKGSYKNLKLLKYHITSAIKYFNKWGWFFDRERKQINIKTLCQFKGQKL